MSGYWYLATPYSRYPDGLHAAWVAACEQCGLLTNAGITVFSPIAHSHPLVIHGGVIGTDFAAWERFDQAMINGAMGMIICMLPSWQKSQGMSAEIVLCGRLEKPIQYMRPGVVPPALLRPNMRVHA